MNRFAERERQKYPLAATPRSFTPTYSKIEIKKSVCKKTDRFGFIRDSVLLPERFALLRFHLRHPLEAGFSRLPSICGLVPFGNLRVLLLRWRRPFPADIVWHFQFFFGHCPKRKTKISFTFCFKYNISFSKIKSVQ